MLSVPESEFPQRCLESHNKYRALHGSSSLALNKTLSDYAQEWANDLASREVLEHRESSAYGENLYTHYSDDKEWKVKPSDPVESWYKEKEKYKFGEESPKNSQEVGHFAQVIWKETKELGVGVKFGENGHVYVVCNYEPAGNIAGKYDKNVLPTKSSKVSLGGRDRSNSKPTKESLKEENLTKFPSKIILTESEKKLGIRLIQPKQKLFNSMEMLAAVPSERLRVWTVWLDKVSDESILWSKWLRGHIDLVIRIKSYLDQLDAGESKDAQAEAAQLENKREMKQDAGDAENVENVENSVRRESEKGRKDRRESTGSRKTPGNSVTDTEKAEVTRDQDDLGSTGKIGEETNAEDSESEKPRRESKEETGKDAEKKKGSNEIDNESWPIGIPWKPRESRKRKQEKDEEEKRLSFDKIPIPKTEEEMERLVKSVRRNATIYRSLHKHWLETGNQAIREILGRSVLPMEMLPFRSYEDTPYEMYLKADADIEIGIEHDDEEVLLPDLTRERVTKNYEHLYFNLLDKPGKGGKPWF